MGNEDQKLEVAQPEATVPVAKVKKARKTKVKEATAPKKVRKTKKSEIKGADILAEILEAAEKGVVTEEILAAEVPSTSEVEASIPAEEVAPVATESVFHSALNEKREVMLAELSQISMKDEQGYLNPIFTEKMNEIAQKMEELKKEAAKIETVEQAQMRAAISSAMNIRDWLDRIINHELHAALDMAFKPNPYAQPSKKLDDNIHGSFRRSEGTRRAPRVPVDMEEITRDQLNGLRLAALDAEPTSNFPGGDYLDELVSSQEPRQAQEQPATHLLFTSYQEMSEEIIKHLVEIKDVTLFPYDNLKQFRIGFTNGTVTWEIGLASLKKERHPEIVKMLGNSFFTRDGQMILCQAIVGAAQARLNNLQDSSTSSETAEDSTK